MPINPRINLDDSPWKDDDTAWFEQNPGRSHRMRMPFACESDKEVAETRCGYGLIMLVRQVEPDCRVRARPYLRADLLPLPDDEATAHGLFEVAVRHEGMPADREALDALIAKYTIDGERGQ